MMTTFYSLMGLLQRQHTYSKDLLLRLAALGRFAPTIRIYRLPSALKTC